MRQGTSKPVSLEEGHPSTWSTVRKPPPPTVKTRSRVPWRLFLRYYSPPPPWVGETGRDTRLSSLIKIGRNDDCLDRKTSRPTSTKSSGLRDRVVLRRDLYGYVVEEVGDGGSSRVGRSPFTRRPLRPGGGPGTEKDG